MRFVETLYATHIRLIGWVAGMILGYFFYVNKTKQIAVNKLLNATLWILSFAIIFTTILGNHPFQQITGERPSRLAYTFYNSSARLGFILSLLWIIFACKQLKTGSIVNWFLSLPQWQPLTRIGLSVYLIHILVQLSQASYQQFPGYFDNFHIVSLK
jgi:hypothetical protein